MKEISVSKRNLISAIILAIVIAAGVLIFENFPRHTEESSKPTFKEESLASGAAVKAIENIYQVNYQEGKDAWLQRICETSTPAGCEMFSLSANQMWLKYVDAKSVITATAQPVEKVADNDTEQVWEVSITLSSPLPGSNKTQDTAYVVVVNTESGWKFDRFLMQAEIDAILNRKSTSSTPAQEGNQ